MAAARILRDRVFDRTYDYFFVNSCFFLSLFCDDITKVKLIVNHILETRPNDVFSRKQAKPCINYKYFTTLKLKRFSA